MKNHKAKSGDILQTRAQQAAALLMPQRLALKPITHLPDDLAPKNMTECYAIQSALNVMLTAAGLGVALPAVLAFNVMGRMINRLEHELEGFAHDVRAL